MWDITSAGTRELFSVAARSTGSGVVGVAFSPDGRRVMTGDQLSRAVTVWDVSLAGDAEWANLPANLGDPSGVAFTPDGRRLVAEVAMARCPSGILRRAGSS